MGPDLIIGIALGLPIALITGTIFGYMLRTLATTITWPKGLAIVGEMLSLPTFWFSGPWMTAKILSDLQWQTQWQGIIVPYLSTLALVFTVLVIGPSWKFIKRMMDEIKGPLGVED